MKKEKDVKVVERLEDINVMEGIDFKLNQKLMKKNEKVRIEKLKIKKNERFNNILVSTAIVLASVIIIIMLVFLIFKDDDKNINDCISKGYTRQACEKSIIGN